MRFLRGIQINIFELGTGIRPRELRSQYPAGAQSRSEVVSNILFVVGVRSGDAGQLNMISVNGGIRAEQSLVHLESPAHLHGTDGVGGHGLVHVTQPGEAWGRSAGA